MTETLESINAWQRETFGQPDLYAAYKRVKQEIVELGKSYLALESDAVVTEEAADVLITLIHWPGMIEAVNAKMAVNRARKWSMSGDGTGQHIHEVEAAGIGPKSKDMGVALEPIGTGCAASTPGIVA